MKPIPTFATATGEVVELSELKKRVEWLKKRFKDSYYSEHDKELIINEINKAFKGVE